MKVPQAGDRISDREMETWALIAEGLSNKLIAVRLGVSEHTAKFHISNLIKKLGAPTRARAAALHERARTRGCLVPTAFSFLGEDDVAPALR